MAMVGKVCRVSGEPSLLMSRGLLYQLNVLQKREASVGKLSSIRCNWRKVADGLRRISPSKELIAGECTGVLEKAFLDVLKESRKLEEVLQPVVELKESLLVGGNPLEMMWES